MKVKGTVKGSKMIKGDLTKIALELVEAGISASVNAARTNIRNAIRGSEPRAKKNTRYTAYGRKWTYAH